MITADEATKRILKAIQPLGAETIELAGACGRYLAEDVVARRTQPSTALSAMDGYAVRHADVTKAPVTLMVVGEAPAGGAHDGALGPGEAVRIFTGGPLPEGADTVVIQENTEAGDGTVKILEAPEIAKNVRPRGLDFSEGQVLARRGARISPRDSGLIAAGAGGTLEVERRPRVALLATGDELVPPGIEPGPNQIVAGNSPMLGALIAAAGGLVDDLGIAPDRAEALKEAAKAAAKADLFITIGGASVGDYDLVQSALAETEGGAALDTEFWKVAIRPGKPLIFGHYGATPMIGLPGNPVSAYVCAVLFVLPAVRAMQGAALPLPVRIGATLAEDMPAGGVREGYVRALLSEGPDGELSARPHFNQDSSALSSLAASQGLIVRPIDAAPAPAGSRVPVIRLDQA